MAYLELQSRQPPVTIKYPRTLLLKFSSVYSHSSDGEHVDADPGFRGLKGNTLSKTTDEGMSDNKCNIWLFCMYLAIILLLKFPSNFFSNKSQTYGRQMFSSC